ncbi:lysine N(6)-hydroxylase/L-ornithine N(5)-oxygenase family protein [Mycolicibacterium sp. HK-90]|uniref:lysine N(6)-hydroxylase/L-ornithine N(5)-oxygenase family protein n=1 Tax=Mycolicibacterium sp. HK-90 TaxID=3056937 RepID=UPI002658AE8A|nr:SidA/IucD/PvdA family monooxygenase [Mycolicibacterium sp. HK-90]WKG06696.1 SidA/IucD/PvdA family monooxygenase [Mycolicibacterium sp. HK-90]
MTGVGFGPANLALAIALTERDRRATFLETQPRFGWHRDMLLPGSRMQIPFLKDLVTLRNTKSEFTFVNYLSEHGRLIDFIGRHNVFPSRLEFHDYLDWAAGHFADDVHYDSRVVAVAAADSGVGFVVHTAHGQRFSASTLVIGTGLHPVLPEAVRPSRRQWHSHSLLPGLAGLPAPAASRFVVVGAGQSAAEVVAFLHRSYPRAQVHSVFTRYGYSVADDSAFANRIFDPSTVDVFYGADEQVRERLLGYHRSSNYSAVEPELIEDLYDREYAEKVSGRHRLRMHKASAITGVEEHAEAVRVTITGLADGSTEKLDCDAVVYATGYAPMDVAAFLGDVAEHYEFDDRGRPVVGRDYRLASTSGAPGDIFLNGATVEHTHGLGATLLSNVAVRAGEIAAALYG